MNTEAVYRTGSKRAVAAEEDLVKPTNALQSDFTESTSMTSDEQYLVR